MSVSRKELPGRRRKAPGVVVEDNPNYPQGIDHKRLSVAKPTSSRVDSVIVQSRTFAWVGETLRRVRKEQGKTLSELAVVAKVGKGQLSRIETGKQEITLGTLAKVLVAYGLTRKEFFRRYDLVEAGAVDVDRSKGTADPTGSDPAADPQRWTEAIRSSMGRIESFLAAAARSARPVAQGGFEAGDYVVLFRIMPRSAEAGEGADDAGVPEAVHS